ncbi:MAG: DUF4861 domain-containing protein [Saprospiraceae bacterium]
MIKKLLILFSLFLIASAASAQKNITITVKNPADFARSEEAIIISRQTLEKRAGKLSSNQIPLFTKASGEVLASQADDLNGDGNWDEAIFLTSFQKKESYDVHITFVNPEAFPTFKKRTQARLAKLKGETFEVINAATMPPGHQATDFSKVKVPLYQVEGPAWENDKVAFRLYFDPRNGKDIYGKTTSDLVLDQVGLPGDNYHVKNWWGMDILKVGASLGAGALAIAVQDATGKNTLVRLGDQVEQTDYQLIANGPVRSVFRLQYHNWRPTPSEQYNISETIYIIAGKYYYESSVITSGFAGEKAVVTGIVNLMSDKALQYQDKKYNYLATHDKQSENKDQLGMGIIVKKEDFIRFGETPENGTEKILQTYYVALKSKANQPVTYKFYAGWEATDARFADVNYFENLLKSEIAGFSQPIKVKFK